MYRAIADPTRGEILRMRRLGPLTACVLALILQPAFVNSSSAFSGSGHSLRPYIASRPGFVARTGTAADASFSPVPGSLTQISVGADGSAWGINSAQQIYTYNYVAADWTNVPGALTQIAVGSSRAVWGLNGAQQVYQWDSVNSDWINIPGSLKQIAVGADGDVWGTNEQSSIYHYSAQTHTFKQVAGALEQIAVGSSGAVYGINFAGSVYWYAPGTGSFEWITGTSGFARIAVGVDGDVWTLKNDVAYHYDALHNTMNATPGTIAQLSVGYGAAVFGLDMSGDILQWNATSQVWVQISGSLSSIATGGDGVVWGLNSSQQIFELSGGPTRSFQFLSTVTGSLNQISVGVDGSTWGVSGNAVEYFNSGTQTFEAVTGAPALKQLSVGAGADVWGVDGSGNIFQYDVTTGTWNNVPGELNFIQVGADASVWGINASGLIFEYDATHSSWINIPGELQKLSVGADGTVLGINAQQQIYRFDATTQSWTNVPGSLVQVSVGNATNVWGVNERQQVYRYNTDTQSWVNIPGAALVDISVAFDGSVWGVNAAGTLYQWNPSTQSFNSFSSGVSNVFVGNAATVWTLNTTSGAIASWFGGNDNSGQPVITLDTPAPGASQLSGYAYNVDPSTTAVVIYALTNQWYVQPFADAPFTTISADGSGRASRTRGVPSSSCLSIQPPTYRPQPKSPTRLWIRASWPGRNPSGTGQCQLQRLHMGHQDDRHLVGRPVRSWPELLVQ